MPTPRKPKSLSAEAPSRLTKKSSSAASKAAYEASQAAESALSAVGAAPTVIPPALDVLIHETAEKTVSEARDAQETLRCATEETIVQTRAAYDKLKHAAEGVTDTIETSYVSVTRGLGELNQKALEGLKAQAEANFEHFKALAAAKSLPEVFGLQTEHARRQFEALSMQMKELADLAQKVVTQAAEPLKSSLDKNLAA